MSRALFILRDLERVVKNLDEALALPKNPITRDSAILRFELAFEVSWKAIQIFALNEGFEVNSPRQAFERAFAMKWISDEVLWSEILKERNLAVHLYRESLADGLYEKLPAMTSGFRELLLALQKTMQGSS